MPSHKSITTLPDSYPIVIKKDVAVNYGLKEAIVLHQINYWVKNNEKYNKNLKCGRWWTYNTIAQWKEQFPFWSTTTIHNILKKLRNDRIIFAEKLNQDKSNHVMFYTLNIEEEDENNLSEKLFFGTNAIIVSKELAYKIGLNEAIVLEYIRDWIDYNKKHHQNFYNNKYWTFNTMEEWQQEMEFFSLRTLERIFQNLFKEGLLIKGNFNKNKFDKTNWYTINYEHKIFRKSNEIINEEIKAEIRNNTDFQKMAESSRHPNNTDFQKMADSETAKSENHIVTNTTSRKIKKETRAREIFLIHNFIIQDSDKERIMKEEKLENEQFMQAFKEYILFCKKKNPDEAKSYDMFLSGFELWCSRYHEVKKTKPKQTIAVKQAEQKLSKLIDWARDHAGECEFSKSLFEHLINSLGSEVFIKSFMVATEYVSCEDSLLCLKFKHADTTQHLGVQTYRKEISHAIQSFKDDLQGVKFLSYFDDVAFEFKFSS